MSFTNWFLGFASGTSITAATGFLYMAFHLKPLCMMGGCVMIYNGVYSVPGMGLFGLF